MDPLERTFSNGKKFLAIHNGSELEIRVFHHGQHLGCCIFKNAQDAYDEKSQSSKQIGESDKILAARFALLAYATKP